MTSQTPPPAIVCYEPVATIISKDVSILFRCCDQTLQVKDLKIGAWKDVPDQPQHPECRTGDKAVWNKKAS